MKKTITIIAAVVAAVALVSAYAVGAPGIGIAKDSTLHGAGTNADPLGVTLGTGSVGDVTSVTAGTGLTGGGTSGALTIDLACGTGLTCAADSVSIDSSVIPSGSGINNYVARWNGSSTLTTGQITDNGSSTITIGDASTDTLGITGATTITASLATPGSTLARIVDAASGLSTTGGPIRYEMYIAPTTAWAEDNVSAYQYGVAVDMSGITQTHVSDFPLTKTAFYANGTTYTLYGASGTLYNAGAVRFADNVTLNESTGSTSIKGNTTIGDNSGDAHQVNGGITFNNATTHTGTATFNGSVIIGDAAADTHTVNGQMTFVGTNQNSVFNTTITEDLYLRGGKTASVIRIGEVNTGGIYLGQSTNPTIAQGAFSANGNTTLGDATTDTITTTGRLSSVLSDVGNAGSTATWDSKWLVVGPNASTSTGAALALGYSTTTDYGAIETIAPGVAWKELRLYSAGLGFYTTNGALAGSISSGAAVSFEGSLSVKGSSTLGDTPASDLTTVNGKLLVNAAASGQSLVVLGATNGLTDGQIKVESNKTGWGTITGQLTTTAGGSTSTDKLTVSVDSGSLNFSTGGLADAFILSHAGAATFAGAVAVNGNTTIGDANTDTLTITAKVNSKIYTTGTAPSASSCGTGPAVVGNDENFKVTTGTSATACTITFNSAFTTNAPICLVMPADNLDAFTYSATTTAVQINSAPASAVYYVHCRGYL